MTTTSSSRLIIRQLSHQCFQGNVTTFESVLDENNSRLSISRSSLLFHHVTDIRFRSSPPVRLPSWRVNPGDASQRSRCPHVWFCCCWTGWSWISGQRRAAPTRLAAVSLCVDDPVEGWTLLSCRVGPSPAVSLSDEQTITSVFVLFQRLPPSQRSISCNATSHSTQCQMVRGGGRCGGHGMFELGALVSSHWCQWSCPEAPLSSTI